MNHLQTLKDFNAWRRSDDAVDQPDPKAIGEAIDWAIYQIEEMTRWKELLQDPQAVHINMLRGTIAYTRENLWNILGIP
jgi:hypothetical protein